MFEKEAEELFKKKPLGYEMKPELEIYTDGFNDGYNKANEWHYVKDGDLPTDEEWKWCVSRSGYPYVAKYEELFVSWRSQENKDVLCPYAWKEIVLPKEIK